MTFCTAVAQAGSGLNQNSKSQGSSSGLSLRSPSYFELESEDSAARDRPFGDLSYRPHGARCRTGLLAHSAELGAALYTMLTDGILTPAVGDFLTFDPPSYRSLHDGASRVCPPPREASPEPGRGWRQGIWQRLFRHPPRTVRVHQKTRPPQKHDSARSVKSYSGLLLSTTKVPFCGDSRYVAFSQATQLLERLARP